MLLVTGSTGFIGNHLVARLAARKCTVRCLVRAGSDTSKLPLSSVELVRADLRSGEGLAEALRGVDTVIHLAGVTKASTASAYIEGNATATAKLVEAASHVRRFVHVSSLAAAGPSTEGNPVFEAAEPHPVSQYGRSKLEGEEAVRNSALWERSVIVRPPVVYGPGDKDVYQLIRAASRGWMVRIGRGQQHFSIIYVEDLVNGLVNVAENEHAGGKIYFLAHPMPVLWEDFGMCVARLTRKACRTVTVPASFAYGAGLCAEWWARWSGKPGILSRDKVREACCDGWVCDTGRSLRELGFCAGTDLEEGLRRTIDWYREAGWLSR
jgi:dihydroflavonol-4-reductase